MKTTVTLKVKGTYYYNAKTLLDKTLLSSGTPIRLKHTPNNPYDKNAVAVLAKRTGAMLGHVSKELAPKYAALINAGKIIEANISKVLRKDETTEIYVRVVYEQSNYEITNKQKSNFWRSSATLPHEPGVYAIINIKTGRQYIGSSSNVRNRIRTHIKDLSSGCHSNSSLQKDFSNVGSDCFGAKLVLGNMPVLNLPSEEAKCISQLLNAGKALYNMTGDGQGVLPKSFKNTEKLSISDRRGDYYDDVEGVLAEEDPQRTPTTLADKGEDQKKAEYIFEALEKSGISFTDFHIIANISRVTLYRWRKGNPIADQFRLNFAYALAQRLETACRNGKLPLVDKLKKEQRVKTLRKIISQSAAK